MKKPWRLAIFLFLFFSMGLVTPSTYTTRSRSIVGIYKYTEKKRNKRRGTENKRLFA